MGERLGPDRGAALLRIARRALENHIRDATPLWRPTAPSDAALAEPRGAFVTLRARGDLRGCIGSFRPAPLWRQVHDMALAAALEDPRFPSVSASEVDALHIDISVLTPREVVTDLQAIEVGRHGLWISRGTRAGVLLPQVATEHGMDRDAFLRATCQKAGLDAEAWNDPSTRVESFEAEIFAE